MRGGLRGIQRSQTNIIMFYYKPIFFTLAYAKAKSILGKFQGEKWDSDPDLQGNEMKHINMIET
jgi:hypothetical protein